MANITEILGTDSVSSSRPTINSNFELLNDELASVIALLNPTTAVLSGLTNVTTNALTINNGGNLLTVSNAGAQFDTAATFASNISLGARIAKPGVSGSATVAAANLAPTAITKGTYFIDNAFTLPADVDGTEVTLINTAAGSVSVTAGAGASLAGGATIALSEANSTITLRCFENTWYVIGSRGVSIQ